MLGVGAIIGSYAWLVHGPMIARAGTFATSSAWVVAAIMTLPSAFILAELSSMFPAAGGPYVFKYYAFKRVFPKTGEMIGFLTGWLFYTCVICALACMGNGFSNLLSHIFYGSAANAPIWFGPFLIVCLFGGCTLLNMVSVDKASAVNSAATIVKFAMAVSFGLLVVCAPHSSVANLLNFSNPHGNADFFANFSSVFLLALCGYSGIEITSCSSSETKDARRSVPRAIILTLVATSLIYVGMSLAVGAASPYVPSADGEYMIVDGTAVHATVPAMTGHLAGPFWGNLMSAAVVTSIVGCGLSCLLNLARVGYSMAATGLFPRKFAELDPKTKAPSYALWFQFWCLVIVSVGSNVLAKTGLCPNPYVFLGEIFGFIYSFLALLYGFCLMSLRYTDPDMPRPFRIGAKGNALAWVMTIWSIAVYGFAAFGCTTWVQQMTSLVMLLVGVPIYFWYRRRGLFAESALIADAQPVPVMQESVIIR